MTDEKRTFKVNDRVRIDYGPGTVAEIIPDRSGRGREPILVVHADVGQAWFRDASQVEHLDD